MKPQLLRFFTALLIIALPLAVSAQTITQIPGLSRRDYVQPDMPDGYFLGPAGNLYATDGTVAGTIALTQSRVGFILTRAQTPNMLGKNLLFIQADGLYKSDRTKEGTVLVKAISFRNPGNNSGNGIVYNNQLFFQDDVSNIWKTDGTPEGTFIIKGTAGFFAPVVFQNKLYFGSANALYSSDGTITGTQIVRTFTTGTIGNTITVTSASPSRLILTNAYYVNVNSGYSFEYELYASDGTSAGTTLLTTASKPVYQVITYVPNDRLFYLRGSDDTIWRSDGSVTGTVSTSISTSIVSGSGLRLDTNIGVFAATSKVYLLANSQVIDLFGNSDYYFTPVPGVVGGTLNVFKFVNGILYFNAANKSGTNEIWRSDGTVKGTYSLSTDADKSAGRFLRDVALLNNTVYLTESIQKKAVNGQSTGEIGQITRIETNAGIDSRKILLADQALNLSGVLTVSSGKGIYYGFTLADASQPPSYGHYIFDTGTASSCSLSASISSASASLCSGTTTSLSAIATNGTAPFAYQWYSNGAAIGGATSATYAAGSAGAYTVQITDGQSCSVTSVSLTVTESPSPAVTVSGGVAICTGQSATLTATATGGTGAYSYQWRQGSTAVGTNAASFTTATPGSYGVSVTDAKGCSVSSAVVSVSAGVCTTPIVLVPAGGGTASAPITLSASTGLTGGADAGATYQWLLNGNPIPGATGPTYTATSSGSYAVAVTLNGRVSTSPAVGIVVNLPLANEPVSAFADGQVTVYPNPATSECWVNIDIPSKQTVSLYLIDALGRATRQWTGTVVPKMLPIQVSLPGSSGLYLLRIDGEKGSLVKPVLRN